jgi:hypothetical protein
VEVDVTPRKTIIIGRQGSLGKDFQTLAFKVRNKKHNIQQCCIPEVVQWVDTCHLEAAHTS